MFYWGSGTNICILLFNVRRDIAKCVRNGDRIESKHHITLTFHKTVSRSETWAISSFFIAVPFVMWLCSSSHHEVVPTSPPLESGLALWLNVTNRLWQEQQHQFRTYASGSPANIRSYSLSCHSNKPTLAHCRRKDHEEQSKSVKFSQQRPQTCHRISSDFKAT